MLPLALARLACGSDIDTGAAYDACFVAVEASCDCWIQAAGWSEMPWGPHAECMERKLLACDDGSWTIEEIDAIVVGMECTSTL